MYGAPAFDWADPPVLAFVAIPVLLALLFAAAVARAARRQGRSTTETRRRFAFALAGAAAWMAATWFAASSGLLARWDRMPPPFTAFVLAVFGMAGVIAFSRIGRDLAAHVPLWALIAVQGFRLPLELAMHGMYERGVMPPQMSYSGWNFDIVTGATAFLVAPLLRGRFAGRRVAAAWNVLGTVLLANVVVIAILSTPVFRFFPGNVNTWVAHQPFVWLPAVMVLAALAGHLIIFRALRASR